MCIRDRLIATSRGCPCDSMASCLHNLTQLVVNVIVMHIVSVLDKPRFARDHARRVHIWAGKTHNITCHVHAYPVPEIEWWRDDRKLTNNQTFHIFVANTHSNLQVRLSVCLSVSRQHCDQNSAPILTRFGMQLNFFS